MISQLLHPLHCVTCHFRHLHPPFTLHPPSTLPSPHPPDPGDPLEAQTDLGPLISARQLARVEDQVLRAVAAGAAPLTGGRRAAECLEGALREGHFYEPTVLSNVTVDNPAFVEEEIFGPVVSLSPFADEDEAISLANASEYGLGGAMWTEDVRKAFRVARRLRCGLTWVNCHHRNDPSSPWGGFGQSGIGRENGPEAFEEYTTTKSLTIRTALASDQRHGGELVWQPQRALRLTPRKTVMSCGTASELREMGLDLEPQRSFDVQVLFGDRRQEHYRALARALIELVAQKSTKPILLGIHLQHNGPDVFRAILQQWRERLTIAPAVEEDEFADYEGRET
ncbi:unnamed protein product [Durusdinium trenchii]|uniref:Aldehyde dehydrogenase domain-containing protein n=1 Tax=Durusdinium trenchii TaxID=1381693 RepID=A0ABP0R3H8_9DINO